MKLAAALVVSTLFFAAGCGGPRQFTLRGSQRDPGADAQLQDERIDGGTHLLTFTGRNMTPPERLGEDLTRYVVWVRTSDAPATMEGALQYDPGSRTGRATVTTPHQHFWVTVTAERAHDSGTPSQYVVFEQEVR